MILLLREQQRSMTKANTTTTNAVSKMMTVASSYAQNPPLEIFRELTELIESGPSIFESKNISLCTSLASQNSTHH